MCWGFRFDIPDRARAPGVEQVRSYHGRVATSGKTVPILRREAGQPTWSTARFGMMLRLGLSAKLIWNARRSSLRTNEQWARLIEQRVAIPINAFVQNEPERSWYVGQRAWLPALINRSPDGGVVVINEGHDGDGGGPILLDQSAAMAWLDAAPWDAIARLDGERASYALADVFTAAHLDRESSSRVPIAA